jgi:biotin carboxyl carrier protein
MRYAVDIENKTYAVDLPDSFWNGAKRSVIIGGTSYGLHVSRIHGTVVLTDAAGVETMLRVRRFVAEKYDGEASTRVSIEMLSSAADGIQKAALTICADVPGQAQRAKAAAASDLVIRSQITGKVLAVEVKAGDTVTQGQTLAVIEAMKMENRIFAPADGKLLSCAIKAGDSVATGRELFKIKRNGT